MVTKSTVPVGSAGVVLAALGRPDAVLAGSNPEFLRAGNAVHDWLHPDPFVIGSEVEAAAHQLARGVLALDAPVLITDPASAETVKYACNAFLAAKVSFVNAIANLCEAVGADSVDVIRGMSYDRRIGADHLAPGPGWGGWCFPKDTSALIRMAEDHGYEFALLKEAVVANERQFDLVADQIVKAAGDASGPITDRRLGLTFKAATDDMRESPALAVLARLLARGIHVKAFDPTLPDPANPNLAGLNLACATIHTGRARTPASGGVDRVAAVSRAGPPEGGRPDGAPGDCRHPQPAGSRRGPGRGLPVSGLGPA